VVQCKEAFADDLQKGGFRKASRNHSGLDDSPAMIDCLLLGGSVDTCIVGMDVDVGGIVIGVVVIVDRLVACWSKDFWNDSVEGREDDFDSSRRKDASELVAKNGSPVVNESEGQPSVVGSSTTAEFDNSSRGFGHSPRINFAVASDQSH